MLPPKRRLKIVRAMASLELAKKKTFAWSSLESEMGSQDRLILKLEVSFLIRGRNFSESSDLDFLYKIEEQVEQPSDEIRAYNVSDI